MSTKVKSELFFVCEICGYKELPNFGLIEKINENILQTSEFPIHCSENMKLTISELNENEVDINFENLLSTVKGTVSVYFTKIQSSLDFADKFSDEIDKEVRKFEDETELIKVLKLRQTVNPTLEKILEPGKHLENVKQIINDIIGRIITSAMNRRRVKKRKSGPIMPGSDPSFEIMYFCDICKEKFEIPIETKLRILNSDKEEDLIIPLHHSKQMKIVIIQNDDQFSRRDLKSQRETQVFSIVSSDNVEYHTVRSVGIDVGSSTTHLIFSRLTLRREVGFLNMTNRFNIVNREILYASDIIETPLIDTETIDVNAVVSFCKKQYKKAGLNLEDIDTGAVIITGETAKKQNADEIVTRLSKESGKFVSATAGPNFESLLSAMGNGSVNRSLQEQNTILSVDIGGGTSNLAISSNGEVLSTACINVGGRLLGIDNAKKIWRIDEPTHYLMKELGMKYKIGDIISVKDVQMISKEYTKALIEVMEGPVTSPIAKKLMMTTNLDYDKIYDEIIFSGGVAEFIYGNMEDHDDIGRYIANEINSHDFKIPIFEPENKIRATVIGAGSFSLSVSGSTCYFDKTINFPLNNIPIIPVNIRKEDFSKENIIKEIYRAYKKFDMREGVDLVALYFKDPIYNLYENIVLLAKSIEKALINSIMNKKMIILLFEKDMASLVGISIRDKTSIKKNLICLDELCLKEGDWIDIGAPLKDNTFPVTIKSLVFNKNMK